MWSSTNQRIKALNSARAREKERLNRPIHVLRADMTLRIQNDSADIPIQARALLNDFSLNGIQLYAASSLMPNVDLVVEIDHPRNFRIVGRVVWCQYQSSHTHVLTQQSFPYRVGIAFKFQSTEEETEFKTFCDEMHAAYSQKGPLKILGDPTQKNPLTGSFTPENLPAVTSSEEPPATTAAAEATVTSIDASASSPTPDAPAAPADDASVTDVLSQLGVELPDDAEKAA